MKTPFVCLLVAAVLVLPMEAKKKSPRLKQPAAAFVTTTFYVVKGFEAFWSGPDEVTIVGPDLNSIIRLTSYPGEDTSHLKEDAIKVVDGLAADSL